MPCYSAYKVFAHEYNVFIDAKSVSHDMCKRVRNNIGSYI